MTQTTILLLTQPQELSQAQRWDAVIAHHRYRIGPKFCLLRNNSGPLPRGGLMVLSDYGYDAHPFHPGFCQQMIQECVNCGFTGAILDFESRLPALGQCVAYLDAAFYPRRYTLYINEYYAPAAPGANILISSAISGGTLTSRLKQAVERYGTHRVVLALERSMEDFTLPAPSGCGYPLSQAQLEYTLHKSGSPVFFSRELCARYFTYLDQTQQVHFVLFDDPDTLAHKLETAHTCGIHTVLLPWGEISRSPQRFGLSLRPASAPTKNF